MERRDHWETVYQSKAPETVSWYAPHLTTSLAWIEQTVTDKSSTVIDIGGGESTLVDDLIHHGYTRVSVLDIAQKALNVARARLGHQAANVAWYCADITQASLPQDYFDVWHDRAVFHFLTDAHARDRYIEQVMHSVKQGGHVMIATFGPEGPLQCSGLDVVRYDAQSLHQALGEPFELIQSKIELHQTPAGHTQQFVYCLFKRHGSSSC